VSPERGSSPSPTRAQGYGFDVAPEDDKALGTTATVFGGSDRLPHAGPYRFAGLPFRSEAQAQEIDLVEEKRRNPRVYSFSDDWLDPALLKAIRSEEVGSIRWLLAQPDPRTAFSRLCQGQIPEAECSKHGIWSVLKEEMPGVYSLRCLRRAFCYEIVEEIERRASPRAPQNMSSYACVLNELGFKEAMDRFCEVVLTPFADILFPRHGRNMACDHRSYMVKYAAGEEVALQKHMDMSDVTLNVCLGKAFKGGMTYFENWQRVVDDEGVTRTHSYEGMRSQEVEHRLGEALIHAGTQVNGAERITGGEKWNLIVWRSYDARKEWVR